MSDVELEERKAFIRTALDAIWNEGHVPRVHVALPVEGLPEPVAKVWSNSPAGLPLDLDPKYPLDLAYTDQGIAVSLAFNHTLARCTLAWTHILAVVKMVRGMPSGVWFPDGSRDAQAAELPQPPAELRAVAPVSAPVGAEEVRVVPPAQRPALRLIRGGKD